MNLELLSDSASSHVFQQGVANAWESLMATGRCNQHSLRTTILSSWQRCMQSATPHRQAREMPIVDSQVLTEAQRRSEALRVAAKQVMAPLLVSLNTARNIVLVTDAQGIILDSYGTRRNLDFAADLNLRSGGNCNELAGGTNAIGTALAAKRPMQVHADEHFYEYVKTWTCAAALVHDPIDRQAIGVLDISGTRETFNPHNLALAISVAGQIEGLLKIAETQNRLRLMQWCNDTAAAWHDDALILLDSKGRVVCHNKLAPAQARQFGVSIINDKRLGNEPGHELTLGLPALPEWVRPEWVHPAVVEGKELGYLIVIGRNAPRTRSQVETRASATPRALSIETQSARANFDPGAKFARIVGTSAVFKAAISKAAKLAVADCPVLLLGETGVGKEEFALGIHELSAAGKGPFVAINGGALPKELAASELFGYADGAFTGAHRGGRTGKFEEAQGGTLFLDEVGELPTEIQVQLLRVLQDGSISRIGEHQARKVNVRIVSATHVDLREAVAQGRFRKDLYYRLSASTLRIAPLRERREDIARLAHCFLARLAQKYAQRERALSPELLAWLEAQEWPGNVRELKNLLEEMWHLSANATLCVADLPAEYVSACNRNVGRGQLNALERAESEQIAQAVVAHGGNLLRSARALGIARSTLYLKLKKYDIRTAPQ